MHLDTIAIVVAARAHGEHGAVVRVMTQDHGLLAGYVRGGRSRALRPVLIPGNIVRVDLRARTETQLAAMTAELVVSRSPLLAEPLAAAAIEWTTALIATALPEGQRYSAIHAALDGVLAAIGAASSARGWAGALAGFERVVLAELGYGRVGAQGDALVSLVATGRQLGARVLTERRAAPLAARERLIKRLTRAVA